MIYIYGKIAIYRISSSVTLKFGWIIFAPVNSKIRSSNINSSTEKEIEWAEKSTRSNKNKIHSLVILVAILNGLLLFNIKYQWLIDEVIRNTTEYSAEREKIHTTESNFKCFNFKQ